MSCRNSQQSQLICYTPCYYRRLGRSNKRQCFICHSSIFTFCVFRKSCFK